MRGPKKVMMRHARAHLGAPAAVVAIAALVSSAAVLGARFGVPEGCVSVGLQERPGPAAIIAQRPLEQTVSGGAVRGDVEQRIALARSRLHITPEQVPHWDAFVGALRDQALVQDGLADPSAAAIEPVGRHAHQRPVVARGDGAGTAARAAGDKFAAAWAALYDRLTDDQKDTAASLLIRHDGRQR